MKAKHLFAGLLLVGLTSTQSYAAPIVSKASHTVMSKAVVKAQQVLRRAISAQQASLNESEDEALFQLMKADASLTRASRTLRDFLDAEAALDFSLMRRTVVRSCLGLGTAHIAITNAMLEATDPADPSDVLIDFEEELTAADDEIVAAREKVNCD